MTEKRVDTKTLREMEEGETREFKLPDAPAINSGKAIAYRLVPILRCRFKAESDFINNTLRITKLPYDKGTSKTNG